MYDIYMMGIRILIQFMVGDLNDVIIGCLDGWTAVLDSVIIPVPCLDCAIEA